MMIRLPLVCLVLGSSFVHAGVIYVKKSATAGGDGLTWATAYNELEHGLAAATSGDEIWIAQGIYTPNLAAIRSLDCSSSAQYDESRTKAFLVPDGVNLSGGFDGSELSLEERILGNTVTILSGDVLQDDDLENPVTFQNNMAQVVVTDPNSHSIIQIDTLTIRGGYASIFESFFGNLARNFGIGGGLLIRGDSVIIDNVQFDQNFAEVGGGAVYCEDGGSIVINSSSFINNSISDFNFWYICGNSGAAEGGGAVYFESTISTNAITITNSDFTSNASSDVKGGGAVYISSTADVRNYVENCQFINNTGGRDGLYGIGVSPTASAFHCLGSLDVINSVFQNNSGGTALMELGGVNATGTIVGSTFLTNSVFEPLDRNGGSGGAVIGFDLIQDCIFSGNTAYKNAGAIRTSLGLVIEDCLFQENMAGVGSSSSAAGGAIFGLPSVLSRCIFENNSISLSSSSGKGGAIWSDAESFERIIDDCLFYGNTAKEGGAIYLNGGATNTSFINCTITQNSASVQAGGIANRLGSPTFTNSIIWANTAPGSTLDAQIKDLGSGTAVVDYSCIEDPASNYGGTGMIYTDPQFIDVLAQDYRLRTNTPCRDIGDNAALDTNSDGTDDIVLDLDKNNRLQGVSDEVDLGAYERCFGDYNNDGSLDFFDNSAFLSDFGQGIMTADYNHDGTLDFFDVSLFLNLFGAGCN